MKQRLMRATSRLLHIAALAAIFIAMSGSRASCVMTGPDVVVVDEPPSYDYDYYPPPVYSGDVSVTYDFGGYSCWQMGVYGIDFELREWGPSGVTVMDDWGLACDAYGELIFPDLPLGDYYLTLIARDHHGYELYWYEGWVIHDSSYTRVDVSLY